MKPPQVISENQNNDSKKNEVKYPESATVKQDIPDFPVEDRKAKADTYKNSNKNQGSENDSTEAFKKILNGKAHLIPLFNSSWLIIITFFIPYPFGIETILDSGPKVCMRIIGT